MGGYWRGEKWIEITWGNKISDALASKTSGLKAEGRCLHCGAEFFGHKLRKWCSKKCQYEASKKTGDAIDRKAITGSGSLRLGVGKRTIVAAMLRDSIGKPCTYCGKILTVENSQIDHKDPLNGVRPGYVRRPLDQIGNLQLICRRCNSAKSNLTDGKFRKLLAFLRTDPDIYEAVFRKMGMTGHAWKRLKGK